MDRKLFNFADLAVTGAPVAEGDIAFDEAPCAPSDMSTSVITLRSLD
jgi:tRNA 2-thiocytidine biosynthesis protein TtcA